MSEKPPYYATQTLLDCTGERDVNRRTIWRWGRDKPVCVFNQEMGEWTVEDAKLLKLVLQALNDAAELGAHGM